ncbi:SRPBCC family protein [Paramicrobacterium sp. CJ85]|uniref:SRPBCC family protein n=1 Tax=Paramicrobacterium sp. CJ85 TaxID=3445355 RepID=UPI003F609D88
MRSSPSRGVFTWGHPDQDDQPIATVELEPVAGGTRQTFALRGVEGQPGDGFFYDGWVGVLDVQGDYLG